MLLPFDIRPDRVGWTVFSVADGRPASLHGMTLTGLSQEDAERAVQGLNTLEVQLQDAARRRVLNDLGVAWLYKPDDALQRRAKGRTA
jgi:hypothetical protein